VLVLCVLLTLPAAFAGRAPNSLVAPILLSWAALSNSQSFSPRRHRRRWLVLASGLIGLAIGVVGLVVGLGLTPWDSDLPFLFLSRPLVLVFAACFMVASGTQVRDALVGTRVREHGIEIFGRTHPPSRIIVKDWQDGEGESVLRLTVRAPRLFDTPIARDGEVSVPVSAADRPALEAFLIGFPRTPDLAA
jgi:hypothetical protein